MSDASMDTHFLEKMVARRRERVRELGPVPAPGRRAPGFLEALGGEHVAVIAEVKRRSPSAGDIASDADAAELARAFEHGGAAAVSVLAEPDAFAGSFHDVAAASSAVDAPVLCKDFVVDRVQLDHAAASGASAVLLIVAVLGGRVADYVTEARRRGLEPLVEVHGDDEYERGAASGASAIGVNARDLRTLTVDPRGCLPLIERAARDGFVVVAESGVRGRSDVEAAGAAGAHAVLVGEHLMRARNPSAEVRRLAGVRRATRASEGLTERTP